ncbi:MAG: NAD(P)/FAD-dependent oxidoreductase [Candidatus Odinarchaeota archaeon]
MAADYEVVIIGAGSIGVPTAMSLAESGWKVVVIDKKPSPGQGENKHAIGGVRATHTDAAKILTCLESIDTFSNWKRKRGDDIQWRTGGYCFVAYNEEHEKLMKNNLIIQKKHGLSINWEDPERIAEIVPGINRNDLRGGTYSPNDGVCSPLIAQNAFYRSSLDAGATYKFKEEVTGLTITSNKGIEIQTNKNNYTADYVVNAAGASAAEIGKMSGIEIPVVPDSHEAGVTEPVKHFLDPMIVDIRPVPGSKNYYFYQDEVGSLVFCITPDPPIIGTDKRETSVFLPQIARRMVDLIPRLKNIKVRRQWRGLYPMTPDGSPIVGPVDGFDGYINAAGMCGQGLMLGPGIGKLITRIVSEKLSSRDEEVLRSWSLYRDFSRVEKLK